jgi:hypothetical protein
MAAAFFRGVHFTIGTCSVPEHWAELIPLIRSGRLLCVERVAHDAFDAARIDARFFQLALKYYF